MKMIKYVLTVENALSPWQHNDVLEVNIQKLWSY